MKRRDNWQGYAAPLRLARRGNDLVACDQNGLDQRTPKSARDFL